MTEAQHGIAKKNGELEEKMKEHSKTKEECSDGELGEKK
jgi:hypothetical protein